MSLYVLRGTQKLRCEGLHLLHECSLSICTVSGPNSQGFRSKTESLCPCSVSDSERGNGGCRETMGSYCPRKSIQPFTSEGSKPWLPQEDLHHNWKFNHLGRTSLGHLILHCEARRCLTLVDWPFYPLRESRGSSRSSRICNMAWIK